MKERRWWTKRGNIVCQTRWRHQEFWHERFWLLMETKLLVFVDDVTADRRRSRMRIRPNTQAMLRIITIKVNRRFTEGLLKTRKTFFFGFVWLINLFSTITPIVQWWPKGCRTELMTRRSQVQSIRIEEDLLSLITSTESPESALKVDPGGLHLSS